MKKLLPSVLLSFCAICFAAEEGPYEVIAVVDGDTIKVQKSGDAPSKIRLMSVDTPEKFPLRFREYPETPMYAPRPSGPEASRAMAEMLPVGTLVWLETDGTSHDRDLAVVRLTERRDPTMTLQYKLVANGWSPFVTSFKNTPLWLRESLVTADAKARSAGTGLWSTDREWMDFVTSLNSKDTKTPVVTKTPEVTKAPVVTKAPEVTKAPVDASTPAEVVDRPTKHDLSIPRVYVLWP